MSDPRDIRRLVGEIRGALETHPREALVEILTYVFKEYVVEGATPLASGAGAILDARTELDGMSFAQVVTWLQAHLDHPELRLLEVSGERVSVRVGGRPVALEVQAQPDPLPPPRASVAAPAEAAARAVGMTAGGPMSLTPTPPVATAPRPQPAAPAPAQPAPPAQPGQPAAPAANNAAPQQKEEPSEQSSRFSLLEVD
jgi:hypothetical protein